MSNKLGNGYWFKSPLFEVELGEDKNTNPFCYGKQLSDWIKGKFTDLGYPVEEVIEEDWGFLVMCQRGSCSLSIGCGNMRSDLYDTVTPEEKLTFTPNKNDLIWYCFPSVEVTFLKRIFGKIDTSKELNELANQLHTILNNEKEIEFVERP